MMYKGKATMLARIWHGKVTATAGGEKVRSSFTLTATGTFPPSVAQEQKIILAVPGVLSILKGSTLSIPRHFWAYPRSLSPMGLTAHNSVLACIAGISWTPF